VGIQVAVVLFSSELERVSAAEAFKETEGST
jgi:hypothetical protein